MESILREWYGADAGVTEGVAYLPKPVHIGDGIEKVMEKAFGKDHMVLEKLNKCWLEIVGSQINKVSRPTSLYKGTLVVEVDNSAWLMELKNYSLASIEKKIADVFGQKPYKKIIFAASGRTKLKK